MRGPVSVLSPGTTSDRPRHCPAGSHLVAFSRTFSATVKTSPVALCLFLGLCFMAVAPLSLAFHGPHHVSSCSRCLAGVFQRSWQPAPSVEFGPSPVRAPGQTPSALLFCPQRPCPWQSQGCSEVLLVYFELDIFKFSTLVCCFWLDVAGCVI